MTFFLSHIESRKILTMLNRSRGLIFVINIIARYYLLNRIVGNKKTICYLNGCRDY